MIRRSFQLESAGDPRDTKVVVGGHDLSNATRGVVVRVRLNHVTQVELDLAIIHECGIELAEAEVVADLRPGVHEALVALGWAPPEMTV